MKPITYWLQNDAINTLIEDYGTCLQRLSATSRRELLACLAIGPDVHYWGSEWDGAYSLIADLSRHDKDLLMAAIASNLTEQENPWLENARVNVAIEQAHKAQKESAPSHRSAT